MSNDYYPSIDNLIPGSLAKSSDINERSQATEAAFDILPAPDPSKKGFAETFSIQDPVSDSHPATKKYADDLTAAVNAVIDDAQAAASSAQSFADGAQHQAGVSQQQAEASEQQAEYSRLSALESAGFANQAEQSAEEIRNAIPIVKLEKQEKHRACFHIDGTDVKPSQEIRVTYDVGVFEFDTSETVSIPFLADGTDYKIFCLSGGTLSAQEWGTTDPVDSYWVGGFHHQDGEINEYSFYDMNYRPSAVNAQTGEIDPRAKVKTPLNMWASIYLLGNNPDVDGVSALGATIADGSSPPIVPAFHGGNGSTTYPNFTQYLATETLSAYGMRLPNHREFSVLADGTVTGYAVGTDPITVQFDDSTTSRFGIVGASGVLWQWGAENWDRGNGSSGYAWSAVDTNGEGQVYDAGSYGVGASLFGGNWGDSGQAGSRASAWSLVPWSSTSSFGARGVCDHFESC